MPSLSVRNATLDYDVRTPPGRRSAPIAVQLHGLTSSRSRDALLGLDLAARVRSHRVVRYDARGHGTSTGDKEPTSYRWSALAGDLLGLLEVISPGQAVHGVGQSMGAGTLLHAAVTRPERFSSLVLGIPPTAWANRAAQREAYLQTARLVAAQGGDALLRLTAQAPTPPAVSADRPLTRATVTDDLLPSVFTGAAGTDLPDERHVAELTIPTLILAWVDDPAHPLSTAQRLHDLMPASRLVVARTPRDTRSWADQVAHHLEQMAHLVQPRFG